MLQPQALNPGAAWMGSVTLSEPAATGPEQSHRPPDRPSAPRPDGSCGSSVSCTRNQRQSGSGAAAEPSQPAEPGLSTLWLLPGHSWHLGPGACLLCCVANWHKLSGVKQHTSITLWGLGVGGPGTARWVPTGEGRGSGGAHLSLDWGPGYLSSHELWAEFSSLWLQSEVPSSFRPGSLSRGLSIRRSHAVASRGSGSGICRDVISAQEALSPLRGSG